jgi:hypothetical protein
MAYRLPSGIKQRFQECGIKLVKVRKVEQLSAVGIHLSRPIAWELGDALEDAIRDLFPAVYVHDDISWELRLAHHRAIRERRNKIQLASHNPLALRRPWLQASLSLVGGGAA